MAAGVLPPARGQCRQENRQARSPESRRVVPCCARSVLAHLQACLVRHRSPSLRPAVIRAVAPP